MAETLLAREGQQKLRPLTAIINTPTLRADGSLLDRPGYDEATGLLLDPGSVVFRQIPAQPSREFALGALAALKKLISTFKFTDEPSRAVVLSAILTALVRRSLPTAPMFGFTAPVAGSGKGLLVDMVSMLASGMPLPVLNQGKDEEETEKRIGAALLAGDPIVSLDNCTQPIDGATLCSAFTQQEMKVRVLGQSKNVSVPTNATFFATGNNLIISGDVTRRALVCGINPGVERPELLKFDNDVLEDARRERGTLVMAALAIMRAYLVAGQPSVKALQFGSFDEWTRRVRDALV